MVELTDKDSLYQHGFPNVVFILPAIIVIGLSSFFGYKLYQSLVEKQRKREEKQKSKKSKKKK